jgi:thioredoxin reductase
MNGNEQKTQLSEDPPEGSSQPESGGGRRGRLKEKVVEKKQGEFKSMMHDIVTLVKSYTELPHERMQAALKQATFAPGEGDMAGSVQILMRNVNQSGDSMTIWIDRNAMLFRRAVIATTYEGNPVTTTANYSMLPSGQVYMAQAILNYPKKQVVVQIDNSNYQRSQ